MKYRIFCFILLCLGVAIGAQAATRPIPEPYRIGVLYWSMNIPGQVAMRQGLEAEAQRINRSAAASGGRGVTLLPGPLPATFEKPWPSRTPTWQNRPQGQQ